jgi:hypothetical protein
MLRIDRDTTTWKIQGELRRFGALRREVSIVGKIAWAFIIVNIKAITLPDVILVNRSNTCALGLGWELPPPPPFLRVFYLGGISPPIVTNPDIISYAHLFPSEEIEEMMSGFTNCTCIFILKVYALSLTSLILIMIFIFHFGRNCPPPRT